MPGQGVFANQTPDSGSIRVLYKTINNQDHIKAITVSDVDKTGDDISISLNELQTINIPLSASGEKLALDSFSINEKNGYFFVDVEDQIVNTISGSNNTSIAVSPYLTETFFYNNYNAIISNAENPERSFLRYDVDRTSGLVRPNNFNALAGFGQIVMTTPYPGPTGGYVDFIEDSDYNSGSASLLGPLTSSIQNFINNRDLELRVLKPDLESALSVPQTSVITPILVNQTESEFGLTAISTLKLQVDDNATFNNANSHRSLHTLATQNYDGGDLNFTYSPMSLKIDSGSFTSGQVFLRLLQETNVTGPTGIGVTARTETVRVRPFLTSNTDSEVDFLIVSKYFSDQIPYAEKAPVQDSNYTDSGIINARYNGTKTDSSDYGGIDPALSATTFKAAVYPINETSNFICSQSLGERGELEEFLFIGSGDLPTLANTDIGLINDTALYTSSIGSGTNIITSTSDNSFIIRGIPQTLQSLEVGELLNLSSGSVADEIVQITNILDVGILNGISINTRELQVTRAVLGTTAQASFGNSTVVTRFSGTRIFKLDKNRLIAANDKRLWVKDNRTIISTSDRGFVISSFTCTV
jgi:hypothetical protein